VARQQQSHGTASCRPTQQSTQSPRRQEIRGRNVAPLRDLQIRAQGLLQRRTRASRSADDHRCGVRGDVLMTEEASQGAQMLALQVRRLEQHVESAGEFLDQGTLDLHTEVAPAAGDSVPFVLRRHVEAADDGDPVVADDQLAVVTEGPPQQGAGIEATDVDARRTQAFDPRRGQGRRAKGVDQDTDPQAANRSGSVSLVLIFVTVDFRSLQNDADLRHRIYQMVLPNNERILR
jgi:hypothetical protein